MFFAQVRKVTMVNLNMAVYIIYARVFLVYPFFRKVGIPLTGPFLNA